MRSIEFHTYLLPSTAGDGTYQPSRRKLTHWQALAWPGATRVVGVGSEVTARVTQMPTTWGSPVSSSGRAVSSRSKLRSLLSVPAW